MCRNGLPREKEKRIEKFLSLNASGKYNIISYMSKIPGAAQKSLL